MTIMHTVLCHIAGMGHCLTGRENSFHQSVDWQDLWVKGFINIVFVCKCAPNFM